MSIQNENILTEDCVNLKGVVEVIIHGGHTVLVLASVMWARESITIV